MADLNKVRQGDPLSIPAPDYNAMIDAAKAHRKSLINLETEAEASHNQSTIFPIRNNSLLDLPRFSILGIDQPIFDPAVNLNNFKNSIAFEGVTPTADHESEFAVLVEPANKGKIANACFGGVCIAKIFKTDDSHAFAESRPGSTDVLVSKDAGSAQILWSEPGLGEKWAYVRVGSPGAQRSREFWGGIINVTVINTLVKTSWHYTFQEVDPVLWTGSGFPLGQKSRFVRKAGGRVGSVWNTTEIENTASEAGNGVDIGSIDGLSTLWPAALRNPGGGAAGEGYKTVVRIYEFFVTDTSRQPPLKIPLYWFQAHNAFSVEPQEGFSCADLADCSSEDVPCGCSCADISGCS